MRVGNRVRASCCNSDVMHMSQAVRICSFPKHSEGRYIKQSFLGSDAEPSSHMDSCAMVVGRYSISDSSVRSKPLPRMLQGI